MCGLDNPDTVRVGARADLFCRNQNPLGSLLFLDPADPDNTKATHVRFTPHEGSRLGRHVTVSIQYVKKSTHQNLLAWTLRQPTPSSLGDLTQTVCQSGTFQQFKLVHQGRRGSAVEMQLDTPLDLRVGGSGIIGRRISMVGDGNRGNLSSVGDGIVGYNC
jgi:hypothetical protein